MDFFTFDNLLPVLDTETLYLHSEFKPVLTNTYNKGCDGDMTGNGRNLSRKLFKFLFFYCDWKSPYFALGEVDRKKKALENSGLGIGYKFQPNERAAIEFYVGLLLLIHPEINVLKTLKESLVLLDKGSALLTKKLNDLVDRLSNTDIEDSVESIENFNSLNKLYNDTLDQLLKVGGKVKIVTADIDAIEKELKKVESTQKYLKGGKQKGNRMDPKGT